MYNKKKYSKIKLWWKRLIVKHKFIELSKDEKEWIKLNKFHYSEKYKNISFLDALKDIYKDQYYIYENDLNSKWKYNLLNILIKIYEKINDESNNNWKTDLIFTALNGSITSNLFDKKVSRIDDCILKICSLIQNNRVIDDLGRKRYNL